MIAVLQRVSSASVAVDASGHRAEIHHGFVVLLCVERDDSPEAAMWMARKIAQLRVFADESGRFNRSITEVSGSVLLVSQFTLAGDCRKGNRPSFLSAADPVQAVELLGQVEQTLKDSFHLPVAVGEFQAKMTVSLVNEGPATFILRR